jgi:hypothetical protein
MPKVLSSVENFGITLVTFWVIVVADNPRKPQRRLVGRSSSAGTPQPRVGFMSKLSLCKSTRIKINSSPDEKFYILHRYGRK